MTNTTTSKSTVRSWIDRVTVAAVILAAPLGFAVHAATFDNTNVGHDAFAHVHPGHGPQ